ncbi:hypothetical protein AB0M48_05910 [Lentzea sp. NPDC051208]|uniref:hypothetical protein n=1 Tax=Lentzea sp. NPDC051208 TaxID=3154642 RepID=UPI003442D097
MPAPVRRSELLLLVFLGVVFAVSSTVVVASVTHIEKIGLTIDGLEDGAVLSASALHHVRISTGHPDTLKRVEVLVDDTMIATGRDGDRLTLEGFTPTEGDHALTARVRSTTPLIMDAVVDHEFTVDNTASTPP